VQSSLRAFGDHELQSGQEHGRRIVAAGDHQRDIDVLRRETGDEGQIARDGPEMADRLDAAGQQVALEPEPAPDFAAFVLRLDEHEVTVSKIGEEQLFYLMSRGLSEAEASAMIISGFVEPITKELPLEYAVELNRLIQLQMEGSVG
jgi:Fe-S cluster assembly protein SufB